MGDERPVDRGLQGAHPVHILGVLRQERVGKAFRLPRRDHPPFNPLLCHEFGEAKAGKDHPDRPHDRTGIDPDLIRRTGQPIAARRCHILDKGVDRQLFVIRQPPDAGGDQAGLHRRSAGRVDDQRDSRRFAAREGPLDQRGEACVRQRARAGRDAALQPDHRNKGAFGQKGDEKVHPMEVRRESLADKPGLQAGAIAGRLAR